MPLGIEFDNFGGPWIIYNHFYLYYMGGSIPGFLYFVILTMVITAACKSQQAATAISCRCHVAYNYQIKANMPLYIDNDTFGVPRIIYNCILLYYIAGSMSGFE